MKEKFLGIGSLVLLQLVIVGNLQFLPVNAFYGLSLPFLYVLAAIGFFIPAVIMTAELATTRPQTGGAYIWCEQAFGKKMGFFAVAILWIANLLWYPSLFSFIASNIAYLINPAWANAKYFLLIFSLLCFWIISFLNCIGIKISTRISSWCAILGVLLPLFLIIGVGIEWWLSGKAIVVHSQQTPWIPNIFHLGNLGFLIAVVTTFFGIEVAAVHAGDVKNPRKNFPRSLLISSVLLFILLLGGALSIAIIIPQNKLSLITGLLDATQFFFSQAHLQILLNLIFLLILIGNLGNALAWMLGSTRGMYVACQRNHVSPFLQQVNRKGAPVGVIIFEAIIFTMVSGVFLLFPRVVDSFWLFMDVASQVSLVYYIVLFLAALRLRSQPPLTAGFTMPGGKVALWGIMGLGIVTSSVALILGFIPPPDLSVHDQSKFYGVISFGLLFALILPVILLFFFKSAANEQKS